MLPIAAASAAFTSRTVCNRAERYYMEFVPCNKKATYFIKISGLNVDTQILLLFDSYNEIYSLRLAPSMKGVAVASQVLCTSTTLNKRNQTKNVWTAI